VRVAIDIGGTFTDLVMESKGGDLELFKSPTIPDDPAASAIAVLEQAAAQRGTNLAQLLSQVEVLIHGTTRGLNAILTGTQARTALVTTRGHPDILVFREGGRRNPFDNTRRYPAPYVSRRLTFEVTERVAADGRVLVDFDEADAMRAVEELVKSAVEAVAVCFLWSIVNPAHELRFATLLDRHAPRLPYTLSHRLNPTVREYRRASSAAIDASLKPLISSYLTDLGRRLRESGFAGRPLVVTAGGGLLDFDDVIRTPIHSLGSGPAMAPVAGRHYAAAETAFENAIVADAGGTSYDVSLVRKGRIPWTRETWLGEEFAGHITGFPSIDVRSIGAGGGSIAWVDAGGLLHVGPESAGADPGPACYGRGATRPTVTDACVVLGYLDPKFFLGGRMALDASAAGAALMRDVGGPLGLDVVHAAAAVLEVVTENMAQAVEEVSVRQGIDPATAALVAGGGSSGFNCAAIARRLRCPMVVLPEIAAGLSAAGGLLADLTAEARETFPVSTAGFDLDGANAVLARLQARSREFLDGPAAGALDSAVELFAEARYPDQVWELEVPVRAAGFSGRSDVEALRADFHSTHRDAFAVADEASPVEVITWGARARGRIRDAARLTASELANGEVRELQPAIRRRVFLDGDWTEGAVYLRGDIPAGGRLSGPAIIESPSTTVVVPAGASVVRGRTDSLLMTP
jgi:N-methylhydantoinase A